MRNQALLEPKNKIKLNKVKPFVDEQRHPKGAS
jgi:hypothetical protein